MKRFLKPYEDDTSRLAREFRNKLFDAGILVERWTNGCVFIYLNQGDIFFMKEDAPKVLDIAKSQYEVHRRGEYLTIRDNRWSSDHGDNIYWFDEVRLSNSISFLEFAEKYRKKQNS